MKYSLYMIAKWRHSHTSKQTGRRSTVIRHSGMFDALQRVSSKIRNREPRTKSQRSREVISLIPTDGYTLRGLTRPYCLRATRLLSLLFLVSLPDAVQALGK